MSVKERLEYYFLGRELKPWYIVNNPDWDKEKSDTTVGGHRIKWTSSHKEQTTIDIDGDHFTLENKISLNKLDEGWTGENSEAVFGNSWRQIKLYDLGGRQLIGISMGYHPCTGIGCSVDFFLVYDLKTKNKSFFGSYRIDHEVRLYDFGNDGTIDFLASTYNDQNYYQTGEIEQTYIQYIMDENGNFKIASDKNGKKYFFKRTFKGKNYKELDKKFVHNWIEEIK